MNFWDPSGTNPVKCHVCAQLTPSAQSCFLRRLVHVYLILSSWLVPFWVKCVHKFCRVKASLCTSWLLGEHIHVLESSLWKLISQKKYCKKYSGLPSQLSDSFYDQTVPHLPSAAVGFLQVLLNYWVVKESRILKLRSNWVTSSLASWPAWKF